MSGNPGGRVNLDILVQALGVDRALQLLKDLTRQLEDSDRQLKQLQGCIGGRRQRV
jgi:hypothetical protein